MLNFSKHHIFANAKKFVAFVALFLGLAVLSACTSSLDTPGALSEPKLLVISVKAVRATSGSNADDIYMLLNDNQRYPKSQATNKAVYAIMTGQTWNPNIHVSAVTVGSIRLMEADTITDDDEIGRINISGAELSGSYTKQLTGDGAIYDVTYEIRR